MAGYLLTWNPNNWKWSSLDEDVERFRTGQLASFRWSCGGTKRIAAGDRLFLLRQGEEPRGIMGSGWAESSVYQDEHWDDERAARGVLANYVDFRFDALLHPDHEDLLDWRAFPSGPLEQVHWRTQSSGVSIAGDALPLLERAWGEHGRSSPTNAPEVQALEGAARWRFVRHYRRERWLREAKIQAVLDQYAGLVCEVPGCGFDFHATYGKLGEGYAQVHHLRPLADRGHPSETRLEDLAIVCANCHAMIHRGGECRRLEGLVARRQA